MMQTGQHGNIAMSCLHLATILLSQVHVHSYSHLLVVRSKYSGAAWTHAACGFMLPVAK